MTEEVPQAPSQQDMFQEFEQMSQLPADQVTLAQLDKLVLSLKEARLDYDQKAKAKTDANNACESLENIIMGMLDKLGRKSYAAEGVGAVTRCMKLTYQVPKTNEAKNALFSYIGNKYGKDVLDAMVSINSQKLTAWANAEAVATGLGQIPGLEAPSNVEYLAFKGTK